MKWIKKVKNWFQDETEEQQTFTIDDSEEKRQRINERQIRTEEEFQERSTHPKGNELETKILFQYPKGQFKFPVIPDDEPRTALNKPKVRKQKTREKKQYESSDSDLKRKKKLEGSDDNSKKIMPSKKPFRPTEIPSAIYGYKRPPIKPIEKEVVIEYELESNTPAILDAIPAIFRKDKESAEPARKLESNRKHEAELNAAIVEGEITGEFSQQEQDAVIELPEPEVNSHIDKSVDSIEVDETQVISNSEAETAFAINQPVVEKVKEQNISQERLISIENVREEEHYEITQPEIDSEKIAEIPNEETEAVELLVTEPGISSSEAMDVHTETSESGLMDSTEVEAEKEAESSFVQPFEELIPMKEEEENEIIEMAMPMDSTEEKHEEDFIPLADAEKARTEEPAAPKKKHLPFNVIMLKPDKDKYNHRATQKPLLKVDSQKVSAPRSSAVTVMTEPVLLASENLSEPTEEVADKESGAILESVIEEIQATETDESIEEQNEFYAFPDIGLLTPPAHAEEDEEWLNQQAEILDETLTNFNVRARVVHVTQGPAVTRFEIQPEAGVKVSKVTNLSDDIKLSLAAQDIRMEAPIPGKHTIGIEIPNRKSKPVFLREVLDTEAFRSNKSPLTVAMGLDISGQPIVTDLRKMPHGLIAGATGSGKSVCINTMLVSLLYKATPQELKLLLIDPKMVELAPYNKIPHLVSPVITDVKAATAALKWAVQEMDRRYELFAHAGVRDITKFNSNAENAAQYSAKLPYIVVVIDELADLMMMSPADVEEAICRIAQKARACGIHLIVATQRPSVDVITGLIKANIPTRIAFSVSSQVDSRTIIDSGGAEKLLGKGDMLFAENGSSKTVRLQGTFVSDDEIDAVVHHVRMEQSPNYLFEQEELLKRMEVVEDADELFYEACEFVVLQNSASATSLQKRFKIGYTRASRLIDMMEEQGFITESRGSKSRDVLITEEELEFINEANPRN